VHAPDRLARQYADQVRLVEEFQRAGVEVVCLNREVGHTPEDAWRRQVQGLLAADERAKMLARHRRGKRQAAHAGAVQVLVAAPEGDRDVPKHDGQGPARAEMTAAEARVVRQRFAWVGHARVTIGDVCRRLSRAGEPTRPGKASWERRAVWGRRRHPAYTGTAAFGKTRQGPWRPRLRAQRGRPLQPRRAASPVEVPREAWRPSPVPAMVAPARFAAVQEPWRDHQHHARPYRRGATYLLQGLVSCQGWGSADEGPGLSHQAATGRPRAYADDRCLGTDADRVGGARVCGKTPVRTALVDRAVGREVRERLESPDRVAEAYRRRWHPHAHARHQALTTVEGPLGQRRQGLARLLDRDAEGRMDTRAFEPRITPLRQRVTTLEAPAHPLADEAALHPDLPLIIGRREDCAAPVKDGLEDADWTGRRELIRALVQRVEVEHDQVQVVFRVDQHPGDLDPENKRLQHCRRSTHAALGSACRRVVPRAVFPIAGLPPGFDRRPPGQRAQAGQAEVLADLVKSPWDLGVQEVVVVADGTGVERHVDRLDDSLAATSGATAGAWRFKRGFEPRFPGVFDHHGPHAVTPRRDAHSTRPRVPNHLRHR
jgi:site-specific DNA recombinase